MDWIITIILAAIGFGVGWFFGGELRNWLEDKKSKTRAAELPLEPTTGQNKSTRSAMIDDMLENGELEEAVWDDPDLF